MVGTDEDGSKVGANEGYTDGSPLGIIDGLIDVGKSDGRLEKNKRPYTF